MLLANHVWAMNHPDNPDSLVKQLQERRGDFTFSEDDLAEAEALFADINYSSSLIASHEAVDELKQAYPDFELTFQPHVATGLDTITQPLCGPIASYYSVEIDTPLQLSSYMISAHAGSGTIGREENTTAWLTLLSNVPDWGLLTTRGNAIVASAFTVIQTVFRWDHYHRMAHTNLLPSVLYNPRVTGTPAVFAEDSTDPGEWSNYRVSARSIGWNATNDLVHEMLRVISFYYPLLFAMIHTMDFMEAINTLEERIPDILRENIIFSTLANLIESSEACLLETGPWENISIDSAYDWFFHVENTGSLARSDGDASGCPPWFPTNVHRFLPFRPGEGAIAVGLDPVYFPPQSNLPRSRATHHLRAEVITLLPSDQQRTVDLGSLVRLESQLRYAEDPSAKWSVFSGSASILPRDPIDEVEGVIWTHRADVRVSDDPADFPTIIDLESTSTQGLREPACSPLPRSTYFVLRTDEAISIAPRSHCIPQDRGLQFEVLEVASRASNPTIHWSASEGTISNSGYFSPPPGFGEYTITASLDSGLSDHATIRVGGCECFFSVSIDGPVTLRHSEFSNARAEFVSNELFFLRFGDPSEGNDLNFVIPDPTMTEGVPFISPVGGTVKIQNDGFGLLSDLSFDFWHVEDESEAIVYVPRWTQNDYIQGRITGYTETAMRTESIDGNPVSLPVYLGPTTLNVEFMAPLFNPMRNPLGMLSHSCPISSPPDSTYQVLSPAD